MVSCSSIEEPETKYLELAGTWNPQGPGSPAYIINIDKDGNFSFNSLHLIGGKNWCFNYTGKLADNFEYPYTIELVYNIYSSVLSGEISRDSYNEKFKNLKQQYIGTFTFIDASTCEARFYAAELWGAWRELICNDNDYYNNYHNNTLDRYDLLSSFKKQ